MRIFLAGASGVIVAPRTTITIEVDNGTGRASMEVHPPMDSDALIYVLSSMIVDTATKKLMAARGGNGETAQKPAS